MLSLWKSPAMKTYKPITFRQLCMVVRTLLLREPTIDNSEWKARTSETLAKMGFAEPDDLEMVTRAMKAVEHALRKTLGPRPVPVLTKPEPALEKLPPPQEMRTHRPDGWDRVLKLLGTLEASTSSARVSEPLPPPSARLFGVTEDAALNEFWRASGEPGADRVALLQTLAEIAIVRPREWDFAAERANADSHHLHADRCFACRQDASISWHHVIQIQHGGSNYSRNRVALCETCHATIHPWLVGTVASRDRGSSWTRVGELGARVKLRRPKEAS